MSHNSLIVDADAHVSIPENLFLECFPVSLQKLCPKLLVSTALISFGWSRGVWSLSPPAEDRALHAGFTPTRRAERSLSRQHTGSIGVHGPRES